MHLKNLLPAAVCAATFALGALPAFADDYTLAVKYYGVRDYKKAAELFEAAMRQNPAHSSALYYDASCYQQLGETERARSLYRHLLAVFPTSAAAKLTQRALVTLGTPAAAPQAPVVAAAVAPPSEAAPDAPAPACVR